MAESLKFNLSFKKEEAPLYKAAVIDQRAPGSFIKDAIEFYLKHLKEEGATQEAPQLQLSNPAPSSANTSDLLEF